MRRCTAVSPAGSMSRCIFPPGGCGSCRRHRANRPRSRPRSDPLVGIPLAEEPFQAGTSQHYLLLAITAAGALGAVWWGRRQRGTAQERTSRRGFALVSLSVTLGMQVYWLTPGVRDVRSSWPLQLSDLADYTAVFALWTRGPRTSVFTYYVGLTLTL